LSDAQVGVLLTSTDIAARLASGSAPTVVCVDDESCQRASEPSVRDAAGNCVSDVQPRNLAYVIYTSGSTGQPKGVMVEHRSVVNLAIALERELTAEDNQRPIRVSLNGSLAFDTSIKQIVQLLSGHRLEIVPDALRFDGEALLGFLQQRKIDRFDCTPSQLQLLIAAGLLSCADAPAQILVGGEPIGRELWARLAGAEHSQFYNLYGPTECTGDATLCRILPAEKPGTIGKALANVQLYNLDAQRQPVPVGVPGELYIGGSGLARGYLNRPELTAERFVEHSFEHSLGDRTQSLSPIRLYKTGDRVRFLPDGRVEFIGRIDNQVKIRGYRIELGEIEAALVQHSLVSAAIVVLREDETAQQERRLVGYVASYAVLTGRELYQSLKGKLPSYMVPSAFVVLEKLPLTANGKIDRRSLPAPDPSQRVLNTDFVAPRNDIEQRLAEIWAELLPAERIGIYDNFFELGGHSLLATRVIARIRTAFAVEIPVVALFEQATIAQLGVHIEALRLSGDGQGNGEQIVARCDRNQPIPASSTQQRWWFFEQLETDSSLYNRPRLFKLRQGLPLTVVQSALNTIIQRHEVIRTTLELVDGELQQKVHETWSLPLPVVMLEAGQVGKKQAIRDYIEQAVQQPFNLSQDLMLRGTFLSLHSNSHNNGHDGERYLLLVMHHAISDHWTLDLLLNELTAICEGQLVGRSPQLPDLPIQYADFAYWQQQQFQRTDFQDHLAYWQQQLSGELPILDLPLDPAKQKDISSHVGEIQQLTLPPYLLGQLKALGQQNNATLFMTLLAAFKVLLYRYTQQTDIIVGIPVAGRQLEDCENLLGCFLNTLAFRSDLTGEPTFESLLQRVRTVSLEAYAHQHCPFEKVIEQLQVERDFSQSPLFNVVFDYINTPPSAVAGSQTLPLTPVKVERRVALFDLTLYLEETANGFEILFEYSPACFEAATISRLKGHFQTLLESIVAAPSTKIDRLAMLTGAERQQLLFEWNQTQTDYPRHQCVHELFEAQVVRQPGAIALTQDQQQITYQQLNQRANQLARYLQSCGVEPGSLVGLYLERSPEMLAAMIAILKAGAAYVTLDPEYPAERLSFMLQDTQISMLLSQTALSQNSPFQSETTLVNIEDIFEQGCSFLEAFSQENLAVDTKPEDLAYVIYTSGSTGKPKGVAIPHLAVSRLVCKTNYIDIQPSDRVAQISNAA
ncbi:MAG: condensation domain-containing protein, partial [Cyanobacteria bacterium J06606_4]